MKPVFEVVSKNPGDESGFFLVFFWAATGFRGSPAYARPLAGSCKPAQSLPRGVVDSCGSMLLIPFYVVVRSLIVVRSFDLTT